MIEILTNWRGEVLTKPLEKYLKNTKIFWLRKDRWHIYNDYNSFFKIQKEILAKKYDIVHLNSRFDIFLLKKTKWIKYIFESHGPHPGISLKYSLLSAENPLIKIFIFLFYRLFKIIFLYKIRKVDLHYVSIPGILELAKQSNPNVKRLPNPVDTEIFKKQKDRLPLEKKYINIFYPTGLRKIKNSGFALELMEKLQRKYKKIKFYLIKQSVSNFKRYKKQLERIEKNIVRLDQVPREKIPFYYSADRDLVLGSFFPKKTYAMLNMIENEAMACKAPTLCCDLNEIIFEPIEKLEKLAYKIIDDKKYRKEYIEKTYKYVMKIHGIQNVAKIYEKDIHALLDK